MTARGRCKGGATTRRIIFKRREEAILQCRSSNVAGRKMGVGSVRGRRGTNPKPGRSVRQCSGLAWGASPQIPPRLDVANRSNWKGARATTQAAACTRRSRSGCEAASRSASRSALQKFIIRTRASGACCGGISVGWRGTAAASSPGWRGHGAGQRKLPWVQDDEYEPVCSELQHIIQRRSGFLNVALATARLSDKDCGARCESLWMTRGWPLALTTSTLPHKEYNAIASLSRKDGEITLLVPLQCRMKETAYRRGGMLVKVFAEDDLSMRVRKCLDLQINCRNCSAQPSVESTQIRVWVRLTQSGSREQALDTPRRRTSSCVGGDHHLVWYTLHPKDHHTTCHISNR